MRIQITPEFEKWLDGEAEKSKAQIEARLKNIKLYGHFGDWKSLGERLSELRWKNGRRVYYTVTKEKR